MRIRLLLVTKYFSPSEHIAARRLDSFADCLSRSGYDVSVLTMPHVGLLRVSSTGKYPVFRVGTIPHPMPRRGIFRFLAVFSQYFKSSFFLDSDAPFTLASLREAVRLHSRRPFHVILSSFAPVSPHLSALRFKKLNPGVCWIADMRDEMSALPWLNPFQRFQKRRVERDVLNHADAITSVSRPILDGFRRLVPKERKVFFEEIRNGFNGRLIKTNPHNRVFTIRYFGSFYGPVKPSRFLAVLTELVQEGSIPDVSLEFLGTFSDFSVPAPLRRYVRKLPLLPYADSLTLMRQSDALLLIRPTTSRKGDYTAKLFDYLASLRPIIAFVDPSDVAAVLIRKARAGIVAPYEDPKAIRKSLLAMYALWRDGVVFRPDLRVVRGLSREEQAKKLDALIRLILQKKEGVLSCPCGHL